MGKMASDQPSDLVCDWWRMKKFRGSDQQQEGLPGRRADGRSSVPADDKNVSREAEKTKWLV